MRFIHLNRRIDLVLFTTLAASLFLMQAAPETEAVQDTNVEEAKEEAKSGPSAANPNIDVVEKKPKKITDKTHPDYVRCKSEAMIGSRAKRKRTCMTNKEWELTARRGNEATRDFVQDNQPGFLNNGPGGR
jgi:hypothetical protein